MTDFAARYELGATAASFVACVHDALSRTASLTQIESVFELTLALINHCDVAFDCYARASGTGATMRWRTVVVLEVRASSQTHRLDSP
jgi:hypothetical protein